MKSEKMFEAPSIVEFQHELFLKDVHFCTTLNKDNSYWKFSTDTFCQIFFLQKKFVLEVLVDNETYFSRYGHIRREEKIQD